MTEVFQKFTQFFRAAPSSCSCGSASLHRPQGKKASCVKSLSQPCGLMDPGTAIGTQDNVPGPVSARTWRAKKGLLEVMTGKTWPNTGLSHKAQNTREYVLRRFGQDCVADKLGRREATLTNTLALPKSVFSYAML